MAPHRTPLVAASEKRFADYDKIIQEYITEGIAKQIEHFHKNTTLRREHHLPYIGVTREDHETTKLHIVFHASTELNNKPLNDMLYSGPFLLPC